jgi:hypothetical protein
MAITAVHTTVVDHTDHRGERTLGVSSYLFEPLEQRSELTLVEPLQRLRIDQFVDPEQRLAHLNPPITTDLRSGEVGTNHRTQGV